MQGYRLFLRIEYSLKCSFKHSLNIVLNSLKNAQGLEKWGLKTLRKVQEACGRWIYTLLTS